MRRCFRISAAAGLLLSLAAPALAEVPPAMDRIPTDALLVTTIRNLEQFQSSMHALAQQIGLPPEALDQLGTARQLLQTPGLNPQGSASFAVFSFPDEADEIPDDDFDDDDGDDMGDDDDEGDDMDDEDGDDQDFIAVIPVQDYNAFITNLGGGGNGIDEVEIEGETFFIKSIGGGFAAAGPSRTTVEGFGGAVGNAAAHTQFLGEAGNAIADNSAFFIVANIPALAPKIREGIADSFEQAQMMGAMMGGGMPDLTHARAMTDAFLRDATAGVFGMRAVEEGAGLEFGAQFKEGSELAGYFNSKGNATQLIGSLPNQPFLFAGAMDASAAGLREALKQMMPPNAAGEGGQLDALNPIRALEHADGFSFLWGTTPALMGGLFLNTVVYTRSPDPQAHMNWTKEGMQQLDGQQIEGITYKTKLETQQAAGREVQTWSLQMQPDRTNPAAQQMAQAQMMMFGPTGLGGYMAQTENGVITTFSRNSDLLEQALNAARTGDGLQNESGIKAVSQFLPEGRTMEGYIGVRHILETALGFAGMMGAGPINFEVPEDLPPIALGGTTSGGGVRMAVFVPADVMATIRELQASMEGEEDWEEDGDDAGLPRF